MSTDVGSERTGLEPGPDSPAHETPWSRAQIGAGNIVGGGGGADIGPIMALGVPGLGYSMFQAVSERDVFVMQNLVFIYSVVFVMLNILVDLVIAFLDPRIRLR